jgi:hypothetical protein
MASKLTSSQATVLRNAQAGHVYRSERGHDLYACYDSAQGRKKVTAIVARLSDAGLLRVGDLSGGQRPWLVTAQGAQVLAHEGEK